MSSTEKNKLLPCQHCGGKSGLLESEPSKARFNQGCAHFAVSCSDFNCDVMPKGNLWHITPQDAVNAWNTRADGWISVEDKLPESCSEVYIWPRPDFGLDCHSGYYYKHNNEWKAQSMQCFGVEDHKVNVTHWMPLPEPPKA